MISPRRVCTVCGAKLMKSGRNRKKGVSTNRCQKHRWTKVR